MTILFFLLPLAFVAGMCFAWWWDGRMDAELGDLYGFDKKWVPRDPGSSDHAL